MITIIKKPKKILDKEIRLMRLLKKKVIYAWTLKPKKRFNNEEGD
jgi:hypothetical protein